MISLSPTTHPKHTAFIIQCSGGDTLAHKIRIFATKKKNKKNLHPPQKIKVDCNENQLIKVAKRLKKNNVSVDIINFGEEEVNTDILKRFIDIVKAGDNSNLVTVPAGTNTLLSDSLVNTPIFMSGGPVPDDLGISAIGGSGGAQREDFLGGVDPNMDPELVAVCFAPPPPPFSMRASVRVMQAIRQSLEEERERQEALARAQNTQEEEEQPAQGQGQGQEEEEALANGRFHVPRERAEEMSRNFFFAHSFHQNPGKNTFS